MPRLLGHRGIKRAFITSFTININSPILLFQHRLDTFVHTAAVIDLGEKKNVLVL